MTQNAKPVQRNYYQQLIDQARMLKPLVTAVAHPVDSFSLRGATEHSQAAADKAVELRSPRSRQASCAMALLYTRNSDVKKP